jgi:hypothetical protein
MSVIARMSALGQMFVCWPNVCRWPNVYHWPNVCISAKYIHVDEMPLANCLHSAKCLYVSQISVISQMPVVSKMSAIGPMFAYRPNICNWPNVCMSAKCLLVKYLPLANCLYVILMSVIARMSAFGQMFVCLPNVCLSAKCLSAKCFSTKRHGSQSQESSQPRLMLSISLKKLQEPEELTAQPFCCLNRNKLARLSLSQTLPPKSNINGSIKGAPLWSCCLSTLKC